MAFFRNKLDQDDLEEEIFLHSLSSHLELCLGLVQSNPTLAWIYKILCRQETLVILLTLLVSVLSVARFDKHGRVSGWLGGIFSCFNFIHNLYERPSHFFQETEWSELSEKSAIFSMQGRRPGNEDRAVIKRVELVEGIYNAEEEVHIWAVMDGHGGNFCADYASTHLIPSLEKSVQKLKILTNKLVNTEKLKIYEKHFQAASESVLRYLEISDVEYEEIKGKSKKVNERNYDVHKEIQNQEEIKKNMNESEKEVKSPSLIHRCQLVLSSKNKPIEEVPSVPIKKPLNQSKFTPKVKPKSPNKLLKGNPKLETDEVEITDYIKQGEILYPKLIKDIVNQFDKEMLVKAKKENAIGGTTLILALLDAGQLWVGNVGDSRAVFGNIAGQAVPMSYDHKPCQLKEKKRIQEAGGFVAMNGVWRVMGVLATSRALGDYPLKDKKVVVSDPDVLSFNLHDHMMEFAVLASDGLWDTHSNEEAVALIKARLAKDRLMGAETLAREAFSRGSLDNITVLVIDLKRFKK